jgi:hypothetical protein
MIYNDKPEALKENIKEELKLSETYVAGLFRKNFKFFTFKVEDIVV